MRSTSVPTVLVWCLALAACADESAETPRDATVAPDAADAAADATDSGADAPSDATQRETDVEPMGGPCPGRDPICDAPPGPRTTSLSRGVTGLAVYESDWLRCEYGADCGPAAADVLLVDTDQLVGDVEGMRRVADERTAAWQQFDDGFDLEAAEGPHLLCARPVGADASSTHCVALNFGADTVVTAMLWTTFGPGALYVIDHSSGAQIDTVWLDAVTP